MSTKAKYVGKTRPDCDICKMDNKETPASYDGNVKGRSSWAYMCESCFRSYGNGLGTGKGQRLLFKAEQLTSSSK